MPYEIPRNLKGESKILIVFSLKALIYTAIAIGFGLIFYFILSSMGYILAGIIVVAIFGIIGFMFGTLKVPNSKAFKTTQKVGGENIDEVLKRYIKFKSQKNKIYVYKEEEKDE